MTAYTDTSVVISWFLPDAHTALADRWMDSLPRLAFSPWTATEFTSALALAERVGRLDAQERAAVEADFDAWLKTLAPMLAVEFEDFAAARRLIRRHSSLKAGDALHLSIAMREKLDMATFDRRLAEAAKAEGLQAVEF